jgi:hypothetical protein
MITNEDQNAVAAIKINPDGLLGDGTLTSTGGAGLAAMEADGQPAMPDSLISQSALAIAGQVLRYSRHRLISTLTTHRTYLL